MAMEIRGGYSGTCGGARGAGLARDRVEAEEIVVIVRVGDSDHAPEDPCCPASPDVSDHAAYDYYRSVIEKNGGTMTRHGATVLGIRGESVDGYVHDTASLPRYDDTMVVLGEDRSVRIFPMTTHPAQKTSTQAPGGAVGEIAPGSFIARPHGLHDGLPSYHLLNPDGSGDLAGWRDYNHDGVIDASEKARSEANHDTLTWILIHG